MTPKRPSLLTSQVKKGYPGWDFSSVPLPYCLFYFQKLKKPIQVNSLLREIVTREKGVQASPSRVCDVTVVMPIAQDATKPDSKI